MRFGDYDLFFSPYEVEPIQIQNLRIFDSKNWALKSRFALVVQMDLPENGGGK